MTLVASGVWTGHRIRKARKARRCEYHRGALGCCQKQIQPGDFYMEGEMRYAANPFSRERYCMECAGIEAIEALANSQAPAKAVRA